MHRFSILTVLFACTLAVCVPAQQPTTKELHELLASFPGDAGLYACDLSTGRELTVQADRPFYLASVTKVLIMGAVYDKMLSEGLTRDHVLSYTEEDYRESTRTLRDRYDEEWTLQAIIDPMIHVSDTAATDRLVKWVGEERLNKFVASLGIAGIGHITSIGELDRIVATHIDPRFAKVPYYKLERWQRGGETEAIVPEFFPEDPRASPDFRRRRHEAYVKYYATDWNSATPRAMGEVYRRIATGKMVSPEASAWMRETMAGASAPRVGRQIGPQAWMYSKDGGKYMATCSCAIVRTGDREMIIGVYTEGDRGGGGDLVAEAGSLAYDILASNLRYTPADRTAPEGLSEVHVIDSDTGAELWRKYSGDLVRLNSERAEAESHEFAAGTTVRAAITFLEPKEDVPMVVIGRGPGNRFTRYQRVFRAGESRSWSPGWPGEPGNWRADFYIDGRRVRSDTWHVGSN